MVDRAWLALCLLLGGVKVPDIARTMKSAVGEPAGGDSPRMIRPNELGIMGPVYTSNWR